MKLPGKRLMTCASFVREGAKFVDIGSDHGYLPVYLKLKNKVETAIAADIGEAPLSSARKNAAKYGADIECILSDGFDNINPESISDAVIAGMGGELISKIINKAEFLRNKEIRLILQPMTGESELREYLYSNGFEIEAEKTCLDEGKIYSVICCHYSGEKITADDLKLAMGEIAPHSEDSEKYAEKVTKRLKNKLIGAEHSGNMEEAENLKTLISQIEEIYLR
ncbi:MAG: class I SAM-dependent methyltransferase [Clostridia bacterium]|nr:class I SAM-dependent methyltransferase [Clostridia bacterium]